MARLVSLQYSPRARVSHLQPVWPLALVNTPRQAPPGAMLQIVTEILVTPRAGYSGAEPEERGEGEEGR